MDDINIHQKEGREGDNTRTLKKWKKEKKRKEKFRLFWKIKISEIV